MEFNPGTILGMVSMGIGAIVMILNKPLGWFLMKWKEGETAVADVAAQAVGLEEAPIRWKKYNKEKNNGRLGMILLGCLMFLMGLLAVFGLLPSN